jgi:nitrate reductase NapAB chaperone NapD
MIRMNYEYTSRGGGVNMYILHSSGISGTQKHTIHQHTKILHKHLGVIFVNMLYILHSSGISGTQKQTIHRHIKILHKRKGVIFVNMYI